MTTNLETVVAMAVTAAQHGAATKFIAAQLGVTPGFVRDTLRLSGVDMDKRKGNTPKGLRPDGLYELGSMRCGSLDGDEIASMWAIGASYGKIGQVAGVSRQAVEQFIHRANRYASAGRLRGFKSDERPFPER